MALALSREREFNEQETASQGSMPGDSDHPTSLGFIDTFVRNLISKQQQHYLAF